MTVVLLLALAAAPIRYSFPLHTPVSATLNMGGQQTCRLLFRKGETKLTTVCGNSRQNLNIPILEGAGEPEFTGQILADDFDFDGFVDLMIPTATGYGGVNWFYDFHHYNPATRAFEPIDDTDSDFCNPEPARAEKTLRVPCKDGPAWYDNAYKFAGGKPYLYRSSELVHLEGFDGDDAVLYRITLLDPQKREIQSTVAEATNENKVVRRKLPFDKVFLHRAPATIGRTESYLVKGDEVELLELKFDGDEQQWLRIAYRSAKAGRLERWIPLRP